MADTETQLRAQLKAARERIDELEEAERQRKATAQLAETLIPVEWGLSHAGRMILLSLLEHPGYCATRDVLLDAMGSKTDVAKNVDVLISKMRKKLRPVGITILPVYGVGFQLTRESAEILRAAIAAGASDKVQRIKLAARTFVLEK